MSNYLLVSHGRRINVDDNFEKSHFIVPDDFNIITFHEPGKKLYNKLGFIIQNQLPDYADKIISKSNSKDRQRELSKIENEMISNYISDELKNISIKEDKEEDIFYFDSEDESEDENYSKYNTHFDMYGLSLDKKITDLSEAIEILNDENIGKIKKDLHFQIRIYNKGSYAPLMDITFGGGNNNFNGIFEVGNLPEFLFDKNSDSNFDMKILDYSIIKTFNTNKAYKLEDDIIETLKSNHIFGNIFLFTCGTYDEKLPRDSLLRTKSNSLQGFEYKYLKYKNKYLNLKRSKELYS